jgi:hypothetical protein
MARHKLPRRGFPVLLVCIVAAMFAWRCLAPSDGGKRLAGPQPVAAGEWACPPAPSALGSSSRFLPRQRRQPDRSPSRPPTQRQADVPKSSKDEGNIETKEFRLTDVENQYDGSTWAEAVHVHVDEDGCSHKAEARHHLFEHEEEWYVDAVAAMWGRGQTADHTEAL